MQLEVYEGKCVHSKFLKAGCTKCLDSCPQNSITISDRVIAVNENCDLCGICSAYCLENAIKPVFNISSFNFEANNIFISCELFPEQDTNLISCVHALGLKELAYLHEQGIREIFLAPADCNNCQRNSANDESKNQLKQLNSLLKSKNQDGINFNFVTDKKSFQSIKNSHQKAIELQNMSRRSFFKWGLKQAVELKHKEEITELNLVNLATVSKIKPFAIAIDTKKCTACNDCLNICPHKAIIEFVTNENSLDLTTASKVNYYYQINAQYCTGCKLCVDICEENAINIANWQQQDQNNIEINKQKCQICGVPFNTIATTSSVCLICKQKQSKFGLYQIM